MTPSHLSPLANHLWQSTLFAAAAWLLTLTLRKNRAEVRYALWFAASLKFLIPFSLLVDAGSRFTWQTVPSVTPPLFTQAVAQLTQPFAVQTAPIPPVVIIESWNAVPFLFSIWLCGFAISCFVWYRWWRRFRAAIRIATPLDLQLPVPVMTSPGSLEPGVFGIFKPVLLLPEGIGERLTPEQLRSILTHELCHVRRRDNLTAALHMAVESIFWFHPLVWWIGKRLVEERERACDEEVVRLGNEPDVYAEGILSVCRFYLQSPLVCASGVTGADLKKRIETIVANRIMPRLSTARKMMLAAAGIVAIGAPVLIGLWHIPSVAAQVREKLAFEVASIKRMDPNELGGGPRPLAPGVTRGGGIRSQVPIFNLICWAYRIDGAQLSGGPAWIRDDRYAIDAKPQSPEESDDSDRVRERVKALLADRFHMVVRIESKEATVFVMSVAKGGHKLMPAENPGGVSRGTGVIEGKGAPISFLAVTLTQMLGQQVLDQTRLDERFNFKVEYKPEDAREKMGLALEGKPVTDDDPRPSIFTALKTQLGLELQSKKGQIPAITIEKIERPTEN